MLDNIKDSPDYRWYIIGVVFIGTFMATLDSSIINVAMPTLRDKLGVKLPIAQWTITAYLLAISSLLPIFGRISDLFGRKNIYSIGFLIFIIGSALCGFSVDIWFLVIARVVQAIGASMLMSNSAAIITANFPQKERGRALGLIGTVVAFGSLTGPGLGGLLIAVAGWRWIFYINLPIGIIGYFLARLILPKDKPLKVNEGFDYIGALLFAVGMVSVIFAVDNGGKWGWLSTPILLGIIVGVILLIIFVIVERIVAHPMIDLSLFKNRPFFIGNLSGWLCFVAIFANNFLLSFYLQNVLKYSPLKMGLLFSVFPLVMAIVAPISGHLSDKYGPKLLTTSGLVICGIGLFYFSILSSSSQFFQIIPGSLLLGLGSGLFQSPNNSSVMSSVPKKKLGTAGSINSLVRNLGMVTGIAYSVSLFGALGGVEEPEANQVGTFMSSYHVVMLVAMAIAFLAAIISLNRKNYIEPEHNQPILKTE